MVNVPDAEELRNSVNMLSLLILLLLVGLACAVLDIPMPLQF